MVERPRLLLSYAAVNSNACTTKARKAPARNERIRVAHRNHYAPDSRGDNRISARPGPACMAARFERDVHRRPARLRARLAKCYDFRMIAFVIDVKAFADDFIVLYQHSAHDRIWVREANAFARELQGAAHVKIVVRPSRGARGGRCFGFRGLGGLSQRAS